MSNKFTLKCGNFAVLVDLHALPQGAQGDSSWFSQPLKEEVSVLIREAVDRRVKQFVESQHQPRHQQQQQQQHSSRGAQNRQRTEHSPTSPLYVKGPAFRLAAYFMKRHVNLRCITNRRHRDLRVFPERFVVCVSRPEDAVAAAAAAALGGNAARPMVEEQGGQSKSEYFSGRGETLDPLNNSAITKRTALQKIAKQAISRAEPSSSSSSHSDRPSQTSIQQQEALGPAAAAVVASSSDSPPLSPSASMHPLPPPPPPPPPPLLPPHLVQERSAGYGCVGEIPGGAVASSLRASVSVSSGGASLEGGEGEALAPLSPSKPRNEHHSGTAGRDVAANPQRQESSSSKSSSSTTAATTTTSTTTTTTTSTAPPQSQPGMGVHNNNNMDSNSSSSSNGSDNSRSSRNKKRPSPLPQGGDAHVTQRCKRLRVAEPPEATAEVSERPGQSTERASPQSSELGPSPCPPPLLPHSRPPLPPPAPTQGHAGESRTPPGPGAGRATPHGRQARRLPLRVSNTEQSAGPSASRLATASLRSLSVKPVSSGSSISSRPDAKEERERGKEQEERKERGKEEEEGKGKEKERREAQEGRQQSSAAAARTSRLRRPKKS
ncbi:protein SLX4IP isoform X2 [Engraulis encrasicolus]|uniref:protein SLX4IP isoform X2 n=1 Tax=Engraulis encrasicolus TaxID=184585 RepID=UPI002FD6D05E